MQTSMIQAAVGQPAAEPGPGSSSSSSTAAQDGSSNKIFLTWRAPAARPKKPLASVWQHLLVADRKLSYFPRYICHWIFELVYNPGLIRWGLTLVFCAFWLLLFTLPIGI